jgi:hypothetical protein
MPKSCPAYSLEFPQKIIDLVRAGRNPDELAKEFEPLTLGTIEDGRTRRDVALPIGRDNWHAGQDNCRRPFRRVRRAPH